MRSDHETAQAFIAFATQVGALKFGEFRTKSGRDSPYFFNAGSLNSGEKLWMLADFYCQAIRESGLKFDMLYGPAYKGIALAVATAIRFAASRLDYPYAFNRKEAKDHGEKGMLVGAPLQGRVLIIDDVITAGISVKESIDIIRSQGAEPCGIVIALDRMERSDHTELSAVEEVAQRHQLPVISVANINDLLDYLADTPELAPHQAAVAAYRQRYGVVPKTTPLT